MDIKLIVFDLDDTLIDTTNLLLPIAGTSEFERRIREPLPLLEGAQENLKKLSQKYKIALVTQGRKDAQLAKIQSCNIASYLSAHYIVDPKQEPLTKEDLFQLCLSDFSIAGHQALSVGNRLSTDIRMAKKCGFYTCHFKYGEHQDELPNTPFDVADFQITNHSELVKTCQL